MHEVREFAGHADIRTTEVYFVRKEEDAEVAARRIQIRLTGRQGRVSPPAAVPKMPGNFPCGRSKCQSISPSRKS